MISLINYSNKSFLCLVAAMLLLVSCAEKGPSRPQLSLAELRVEAEGSSAIRDALQWTCVTENGVGELTFEYQIIRNGVASRIYQGPAAEYQWIPKEAGNYQLKVIVRDSSGGKAESPWSKAYQFEFPVNTQSLYAVWPIENLSANKAPLQQIRNSLVQELQSVGLKVLDDDRMEDFLRKARIRYVGGIDSRSAQELAENLGVAAVFVTSLETWHDRGVPRISLISRLVATGQDPEIAWIDSVGLTGDDQTGLLGLGRVTDPAELTAAANKQLVLSLRATLQGKAPTYRHSVDNEKVYSFNSRSGVANAIPQLFKKTHKPRHFFRSERFDPAQEYRVAMVPFLNINARKDAGKIVALHLIKQLHRHENIRIFEPGVIRDVLLRYRMIMQSGPSLAASDILASDRILGADLIMSGKVFDYQDAIGESKIDFSTQIFAGKLREVIWTSHSYAGGNDGVYFFDFGKITSAHDLLSPMTHTVVKTLED